MDKCLFCGGITHHDVSHFHGRISNFCAKRDSPNCGQNWQNFKIRVNKHKNSPYIKVKELAYKIEEKVFENSEPAIDWNRQLISTIKLEKKLALEKVVQK